MWLCVVMYGQVFAISMTEQDYECQRSVMEFPQSHKYTRGPHPQPLYVQVTGWKSSQWHWFYEIFDGASIAWTVKRNSAKWLCKFSKPLRAWKLRDQWTPHWNHTLQYRCLFCRLTSIKIYPKRCILLENPSESDHWSILIDIEGGLPMTVPLDRNSSGLQDCRMTVSSQNFSIMLLGSLQNL